MEWGGAGGGVGVSFDYQLINFFFNFFFGKNLEFYTVPSKAIIPIVG